MSAMPVPLPLLQLTMLAASGESDTGGKDPGESASAWHVGGALFWIGILLIALVVLVVGIVLATRGGDE